MLSKVKTIYYKTNMAQVLNEQFIKMQKLAGIITEGEYKMKMEAAAENTSPEQAAKTVVTNYLDDLERNPKVDNVADKIANDPKAVEQLNALMSKFNISMNEGDVEVNPQDVMKIATAFAKKAETLKEESGYHASFWVGLLGGGALAKYIASMGDVPSLIGAGPSHMGATMLGGLAGATLLLIARAVYNKLKG